MKKSDFTPHIRLCTPEDLDDIMDLQERICASMPRPDLFVATCREENASYLAEPNVIFGTYDHDRLIAYASLAFPEKASDNLGWDLGWDEDTVRRCAKLDTIVVDPAYRGYGLQRTLISHCLSYAKAPDPDCFVLTTVSPANTYSLRNVQSEGFQILKRMTKYGSRDRYVLGYHASGHFPEIYPHP